MPESTKREAIGPGVRVRKRRERQPSYPTNWYRCRTCGDIVALGSDHECEPAMPTDDHRREEADPDEEKEQSADHRPRHAKKRGPGWRLSRFRERGLVLVSRHLRPSACRA
jgi:hypothetical protein